MPKTLEFIRLTSKMVERLGLHPADGNSEEYDDEWNIPMVLDEEGVFYVFKDYVEAVERLIENLP